VTAGRIHGATGHGNLIVRFKNRSNHTCTLRGYPGITAMTKEGQTVKHAKHTLNGFTGGSHHGVQTITVAPGHYASADVEWHNFNFSTGHNCRFAPFIEIRPAHTTLTAVKKRSVSRCGLQVHPTVAGRSGSSAAALAADRTVSACGNHALKVTATHDNGATGHGNLILRFKNRTGHSCTIHGYPGLDALGKHHGVLKHAKRTVNGFTGGSHHGVQTITVAPGHYASADVEWHNFNFHNGNDCRLSHYIAATPANTSHTVIRRRGVSLCGLQVHPTVAGRSGNS
jgi:hypothetical protein